MCSSDLPVNTNSFADAIANTQAEFAKLPGVVDNSAAQAGLKLNTRLLEIRRKLEAGGKGGVEDYAAGAAGAQPVVDTTTQNIVNSILGKFGVLWGKMFPGGQSSLGQFKLGMEAEHPNLIAVATNILTSIKNLFGGSLPTAGPLRDGKAMYEGGRALVRQFGEERSEERRVGKECRSRWSPDH